MKITLYGIPNCDQVKKARAWLSVHDLPYEFHDFKKAGISLVLIQGWLQVLDWETLVNRKGTTWRGVPDARKAEVVDANSATTLMLELPSVVKRPVLVVGDIVKTGFSDESYRQIFKK